MTSLPKLFKSLLFGAPSSKPSIRKSSKIITERSLLEEEAAIGREVFGPVAHGHKRDFFLLDEKTWVWHEEWKDAETNQKRQATIRYEIQRKGILKVQNGRQYSYVEGQELTNLYHATKLYYERAMREVYNRDPYTGQVVAG